MPGRKIPFSGDLSIMPELWPSRGEAIESGGYIQEMKVISQILVVAIINLTCTYSYAWVDSATTIAAIHKKSITQIYRQQLLDLAERQEVIDQLVQYGVSREEAINRINSLTDEEIRLFFENMDQLPSGGQEFGEGPVSLFFLIVLLSPFIVIGVIVWVSMKISSPVLCLFHLDEYKNCLEDPRVLDSPSVMKKVLKPSQGATCLEPCYSDFNDCMDSSDDAAEENQCDEEKNMCVQQCEGSFN
jgi:uncharacterized protein DUF6627